MDSRKEGIFMKETITGHTQLTCLLGSPVEHSISPKMHNLAFSHLDLDYAYLAFDINETQMEDAIQSLKLLSVKGFNVTMPGKNRMYELADDLSTAARLIGACNTVVNENGRLIGHNTDGVGFMRALEDESVHVIGKKMTLLGAGGAATAILVQAALDGVQAIDIFSIRDQFFDRAIAIVDRLNHETDCHVTLYELPHDEQLRRSLSESQLLVNATSVGMAPRIDASIIEDASFLHPNLAVFDIIYNPAETKLLQLAKEVGCQIANGNYMLLYQGAEAFKLWTGKEMPIDLVKKECF